MPKESGDQAPETITPKGRVRQTARRIHAEAKQEEAKLRARGWQQTDFARALIDLLDEPAR